LSKSGGTPFGGPPPLSFFFFLMTTKLTSKYCLSCPQPPELPYMLVFGPSVGTPTEDGFLVGKAL